ncbi:MAG: hypothetical protein EOP52_10320 [Sphingobacteriales bacterium]|nr:MAG: hypothetical protein EOP52_10320 [Sphingobacteriales bacterium]
MKRLSFSMVIVLLLLTVPFSGSSQKPFKFQLPSLDPVPFATPYRKIHFRYDQLASDTLCAMGTSAYNLNTFVVAQPSLKEAFENLPGIQFEADAQAPVLFIHLRHLHFYNNGDTRGTYRKTGYSRFKADIYAQYNDSFIPVRRVDTFILIDPNQYTIVEPLNLATGQAMIHILKSALKAFPPESKPVYTFNQIMHSDSLDRAVYPLYTAKILKDGIYHTFNSLLNQTPDLELDSTQTWGPMRAWNPKRKKYQNYTFNERSFAYVRGHKAFIGTPAGSSALEKCGSDFCFTATTIYPAPTQVGLATGIAFGAVGGLIGGLIDASGETSAIYKYKINPVLGAAVRMPSTR